VHTITLTDLVLNAIALECVLSLDEMVFEAFAPMQMVSFLRNIEPMPSPSYCYHNGFDWSTILGLLTSALVMATLVPFWLAKEVSALKRAESALCDGVLDFVTGASKFAPYFTWAVTLPADGNRQNDFAESLTNDIIAGSIDPAGPSGGTKMPTPLNTAWAADVVYNWDQYTASSKLKEFLMCRPLGCTWRHLGIFRIT